MELKQSTVAVVKIGPFVGTTGTAITDLTIPQASIRLSKVGGNMAQKSTATACVHDEIGVYFCDLSAADTGTLGILRLDVDKSGSAALAVWHFYEIVTAQYYDAKYGTGRFEADMQEIDGASAAVVNMQNMYDGTGYAGGTIKFITTGGTVSTIAAGAIASNSFAADAIDATAIAGSALVAASFATGALAAGAASAATIAANALGTSAATIAASVWGAVAASYNVNDTFGNVFNDLTEDSGGTYRFTALAVALGACSGTTINAQMLDVLNVDTFAKPGQAAPGATTTIIGKVGYLYKFMRNKVTATSALIAVYNDDGSTVGQKSVISDDATTYTRGEFGTGA